MSLISIQNAKKEFNVGGEIVSALDGVNLEIAEGEFVAIVGKSGSGKSTLMNTIGCLDTLSSGEYYLNGQRVCDLNDRALSAIRSHKIGFIFQGFNLIPTLTALENVELPLNYRRLPHDKCKKFGMSALESVGLESRVSHLPSELSGGQQQRVAIARAISTSPPIILADEPTGNLDSSSGDDVMKILRQLNDEGRTVILITHDTATAKRAHRIVQISDGKIVSDSKNCPQ